MSLGISTKIILTKSGETVKGYWLSESGYKIIVDMISKLDLARNKIVDLQCQIDMLYDMLKAADLKAYFKKKISNHALFIGKSFHRFELMYDLSIPKYFNLAQETFDVLVKEGIIEYRGSGWYRAARDKRV